MSAYALIKDGIVVNAVLWDGEGDLFQDFETHEIKEGEIVGPGFFAEADQKGNWTFTAPVTEVTEEEKAEENLRSAQAEYDLASAQITALNQRIEDEDYSGEYSQEAVVSSKIEWTNYRKVLRAYLAAGDGTSDLSTRSGVKKSPL
ncbi:hypothetical protein ABEG72_15900 [Pantoea agglomerans]|uniref:hypothetical protein n=1 Tax=Enterobacter agglomerans TaxID=549 RepID=UPI003209668A